MRRLCFGICSKGAVHDNSYIKIKAEQSAAVITVMTVCNGAATIVQYAALTSHFPHGACSRKGPERVLTPLTQSDLRYLICAMILKSLEAEPARRCS